MKRKIELDLDKIVDCKVEGINHRNALDFVDSYISSAWIPMVKNEYLDCKTETCVNNGKWFRALNDEELDSLNEEREFVYKQIEKHIY
jgi:hypothetical protein